MLKEFKTFAMRGNVIDMAVGIIIGTAFGKIISSLVNDILMPPLGLLLGRVDLSHFVWQIKLSDTASVTMNYGLFINSIIDFILVAFAMFILIKHVNRLTNRSEKLDTKDCIYCYSKIAVKATRCPNCTSNLSE